MFTSWNFFCSVARNRVAKLLLHSFIHRAGDGRKISRKLSSGTSFRIHDFLWARKIKRENFCRVEAKWIFFPLLLPRSATLNEEARGCRCWLSLANYFDLSPPFVTMILYWQRDRKRFEKTASAIELNWKENLILKIIKFIFSDRQSTDLSSMFDANYTKQTKEQAILMGRQWLISWVFKQQFSASIDKQVCLLQICITTSMTCNVCWFASHRVKKAKWKDFCPSNQV